MPTPDLVTLLQKRIHVQRMDTMSNTSIYIVAKLRSVYNPKSQKPFEQTLLQKLRFGSQNKPDILQLSTLYVRSRDFLRVT